jgi:hyperosmotically inducible protein
MNTLRAFLATLAAAVVAIGITACDRPTERDRPEGGTPPPTSRAPSAPATAATPTTPATPSSPTVDRSVGQTLDDAGITAKVKTALAAEKDVSALAIDVDTVQGNVTLSGRVTDQSVAQRAIQVARSVEGVKSVDNKLAVGS